jgi:hypothetical protein
MNADMYSFLLHLHSVGRWLVLILLIVAIFNSMVAGSRPFIRSDARTGTILVIFADLMFLIGVGLWFSNPKGLGYQSFKTHTFSEVMNNSYLRFFGIEHISMMLIAIILLHIGKAQGKKAISDKAKHTRTLVFYLLALLLIMISIPWPFRAALGGHWY